MSKHVCYTYKKDDDWKEQLEKMKENDILDISSFSALANDGDEFKNKLYDCYEKGISLSVNGNIMNIEMALELIEYYFSIKQNELKKKRAQGIKMALEKKKNGVGEYGRPAIKLPDDFEEAVKLILMNQYTCVEYIQKTGLKKSTFYKYFNKYKAYKEDSRVADK